MRFTIALVAGLLAALAPQASSPPGPAAAAVKLESEIARARALLEASAPDAERASPVARLDRARAALERHQLLLATYLTEAGWEAASNWAFVKASSDVTTTDAFLKKWTATGEPKRAAPARTASSPRPLLIDAIAAAAEARGPATYHAARPYADDSGLFGGLYYLGDSQAVMEFARTIREWDWPAAGARPPLRAVSAEIAALDTEMTTAYEKMDRAQHPTYISASAALKQARTLDESGRLDGALFEYLLARYLFAPLRGPAAAAATTERVAEARASFAGATDHTIVELFLQLADEALAGGSDAQRRGAAAVLDDIVPAYRAAIAPPSTTITAASSGPAVTITLVRWPFT